MRLRVLHGIFVRFQLKISARKNKVKGFPTRLRKRKNSFLFDFFPLLFFSLNEEKKIFTRGTTALTHTQKLYNNKKYNKKNNGKCMAFWKAIFIVP